MEDFRQACHVDTPRSQVLHFRGSPARVSAGCLSANQQLLDDKVHRRCAQKVVNDSTVKLTIFWSDYPLESSASFEGVLDL